MVSTTILFLKQLIGYLKSITVIKRYYDGHLNDRVRAIMGKRLLFSLNLVRRRCLSFSFNLSRGH